MKNKRFKKDFEFIQRHRWTMFQYPKRLIRFSEWLDSFPYQLKKHQFLAELFLLMVHWVAAISLDREQHLHIAKFVVHRHLWRKKSILKKWHFIDLFEIINFNLLRFHNSVFLPYFALTFETDNFCNFTGKRCSCVTSWNIACDCEQTGSRCWIF